MMRRALLVLAFTLLAALAFALPAQADERIRAGSCDVWATEVKDPIAKTSHIHHFTGGIFKLLTNDVTGSQVKNYNQTSCSSPGSSWATSLRWFPTAKGFDATKDTLYYRDPGNFNNLRDIPTDLRLIADHTDVTYKGDLTTIRFPNCIARNPDGSMKLDSANHRDHAVNRGANACPSSHPLRIPQASYLIHWERNFTASTLISMGANQWAPAGDAFHADYLAANQDVFNDRLIDLCLNTGNHNEQVHHPDCGPEP